MGGTPNVSLMYRREYGGMSMQDPKNVPLNHWGGGKDKGTPSEGIHQLFVPFKHFGEKMLIYQMNRTLHFGSY